MSEALWAADVVALVDLIRGGELKAVELLDLCLERIGRYDGAINSFALLDPAGARAQAEEVDRRIASGEDPGPLAGVPVGVKDLENVAGLPTQRGSLLFEGAVADRDSTQVSRLRTAGAVILGKTTTPEMGSSNFTASKAYGTTRNPWNLELTPGGSSGGSAAAVAAGLVPLATGSDGGGSIRIPASYTGLPGLKVTYGLVARGPGRLASAHLSTYGPVVRSVRDIARVLDRVAGHHPMDAFSLPRVVDSYEFSLDLDLSAAKATWSATLGFGVCEPEVASIARAAADRLLEAAGLEEVDVPVDLPDAGLAWSTAWAVDCFTELESFWPQRSEDLTPVVALAMQLAEGLEPGQMAEAARARYQILSRVNQVFEQADFILTPATPTTAFPADGPSPSVVEGRPLRNPLLAICFTFPFNLSGHPAISVPAGLDADGMPVALQIVGPRLSEPRLLALARVVEQTSPWPKVAPSYA